MSKTLCSKRAAHANALTTGILWSFAFVCVKKVMGEFHAMGRSPIDSSLTLYQVRITLATLPFIPYLFIQRNILKQTLKDHWIIIIPIGAVSTYGYHIPINLGALELPAGFVGLIIGTTPILTGCLARIFLKEEFGLFRILAVISGFAGIVLCQLGQNQLHPELAVAWGAVFLVMISACSGATYAILGRLVPKNVPIVVSMGLGMVIISITMIPLWKTSMFTSLASLSMLAWFCILYLSFCLYLGSVLWFKALQVLESIQVAIYLNVTTVLGVAWGFLFFNEIPNAQFMLGAFLILVALFLTNFKRSNFQRKHPGGC